MENGTKLIFFLVAIAFVIAFVLLYMARSDLPDVILGLPKNMFIILPWMGAVLSIMGWEMVKWYRQRDE